MMNERTPHPRVIFETIEEALEASPFFIDEQGVGIWLSTDDERLLAKGKVILSTRNAIHIPSLEKNGRQIPVALIETLSQQAQSIGLDNVHMATGYWTLSETSEMQSEQVLIAFTEEAIDPEKLRRLAVEIIHAANQDAVAIEVSGRVEQMRKSAEKTI